MQEGLKVLGNRYKQWQHGNQSSIAKERYGPLISCIVGDFSVCVALGDIIKEVDEMNGLAKALLNLGLVTKRAFPMLLALLVEEVKKDSKKKGNAILRGNSLATKIETSYCKSIGKDYIVKTLQDLLVDIVQADTNLDLQINPDKVQDGTKLTANQKNLELLTQRIFNRLIEPKSIENMPREMRAIAAHTSDLVLERMMRDNRGRSLNLSLYPLRIAGSFLFLRFFNPAIISPEKYGIVPRGTPISAHTRSNLIIISKVLQKLSNDVMFEDHTEAYAKCMNSFLERNRDRCNNYFRAVINDPLAPPGKPGWLDIKDPAFGKTTDLTAFYHLINVNNLVFLHQILWKHRISVFLSLNALQALQKGRSHSVVRRPDVLIVHNDEKNDVKFLKTLAELGPPPKVNSDSVLEPVPAPELKMDETEEIKVEQSTLASDMATLLNNEEYSDISFEVEGKKIYAHRCILQVRAPAFLKYLQEGSGKVTHMGGVSNHRDEAFGYDGYMSLLQYIYTGAVDITSHSSNLANVLMHNAIRFELYPLAVLTCKKMYKTLSVENVVALLSLSKRLHSKAMAMQCLRFIRGHIVEVLVNKVSLEELQQSPKRVINAIGQSWDPQADISALADSLLAPGLD